MERNRQTFFAAQTANLTVVVVLSAIVFVTLCLLSCKQEEKDSSRELHAYEVAAPPLPAPKADTASTSHEEYGTFDENPFVRAAEQPTSTFAVDVDRASYSNVRRFVAKGMRPPRDAVRIEELINYFTYDYPQPRDNEPFSITTEIADCPWNAKNRLMLVALQAPRIATDDLPPNNLVFLVDTSGSMMAPDKLPLLQSSLLLVTDQLRAEDRVAIVAYAGSAGLVLPSTSGSKKETIRDAINALEGGGSTAGGEGIELAYGVAKENFMAHGNNRVILATDGDFNVGPSSDTELEELITARRGDNIFLTVLGFGTGNVKDSKMELLADKGNGNYAYIDTIAEARKTLVREMGATLLTVAKDVKIQLEFDPAQVSEYRLIGYENRLMSDRDFADDTKDGGEIGAGHSVTALYELVTNGGDAAATVKVRYKAPDGDTSREITHAAKDEHELFGVASDNLRFAAAVAELGMLLRDSKYKGESSFREVERIAVAASGRDEEGYRKEFVQMVRSVGTIR